MKSFLFSVVFFTSLLFSVTQAQIPAMDWVYTFGDSLSDIIVDSDLDSQENIISVGSFKHTVDFDNGPGVEWRTAHPGQYQMYIQKVSSSGHLQWVKTFGGNGLSRCTNVLTLNGGIYVTGDFTADSLDFDPDPASSYYLKRGPYPKGVFILKLDDNGDFQWAIAQGSNDVKHKGMKLDQAGNLFSIGVFAADFDQDPDQNITSTVFPQTAGKLDFFIQKLDSAGNQVWLKTIKGIDDVSAEGIVIDSSQQPVIVGHFINAVDFDPGPAQHIENPVRQQKKAFILRLSSAGNFISVNRTGGNGMGMYLDVTQDKNYNLYLAGFYQGAADLDPGNGIANPNFPDREGYFIQKMDAGGNLVWLDAWETNLSFNNFNRYFTMVVDSLGNIYTGGVYGRHELRLEPEKGNGKILSNNQTGSTDIFLVKQDSAGVVEWAHSWQTRISEYANRTLLTSSGSVILSGYYNDSINFDPYQGGGVNLSNGWSDAFILKLKTCPPPKDSIVNVRACKHFDINGGIRVYKDTLIIDTIHGSMGNCDQILRKQFIEIHEVPVSVSLLNGTLKWGPGNTNSYSFQWYDCSRDTVIPYQTAASFTPQQNGSYALIVSNGLCTDTSACFVIDNIGIEELDEGESVSVYPNPVDDILWVSGMGDEVDMKLYDVIGKQVIAVKGQNFLDLGNLPEGTYFLLLEKGSKRVVKKVIHK